MSKVKLFPYDSADVCQGNSADESSSSSYKPSDDEENLEILSEDNEVYDNENVIQVEVEAINKNELNNWKKKKNPNINEWLRNKDRKLRMKGERT